MAERRPNKRDLCPDFMAAIKLQGYETVGEFALAKGLPNATVLNYADLDKTHENLISIVATAKAAGISVDDFVKLLLSKSKRKRKFG